MGVTARDSGSRKSKDDTSGILSRLGLRRQRDTRGTEPARNGNKNKPAQIRRLSVPWVKGTPGTTTTAMNVYGHRRNGGKMKRGKGVQERERHVKYCTWTGVFILLYCESDERVNHGVHLPRLD